MLEWLDPVLTRLQKVHYVRYQNQLYGKDNIRVNSVHPGIIATPMTAHTMEEGMPFYQAHTQLLYMGEPEDVAYGVLILASDETRFMTGAELVIDGGWTAL